MRETRYRRIHYMRLPRRTRALIWLGLVCLLVVGGCCLALMHMRPILTSLARSRVSNSVSRIVVAAVNDAVRSGQIDYHALIDFEKDAEGHVTALRSNMSEFNRLQVQIADDILGRLSEVSASELSIPVGTLTGSSLLAGRGPAIHVRMQAVGSAKASLRNAFTSAGINQTRHQVLLDVSVSMSILLPGFITDAQVTSEIAVAETVIVGGVPNTYTYFSTTPDEVIDYADEYIMNNG